jgi:hypothetical protein
MCVVRPDTELPTACKLQTLGLIAAFGFDDLGDPRVPVGTRRHVAVIVAAPLQLRPANLNGYIKGPMHKPIPASYWVVDGMLLAGEYAGASTPARARPKLEALLDAGIRAFFDLTEEGELPPYQDLLRDLADDRCLSVAYDRVPIRDAGVPDPADLHRLLSLLETNVDRGIPSCSLLGRYRPNRHGDWLLVGGAQCAGRQGSVATHRGASIRHARSELAIT